MSQVMLTAVASGNELSSSIHVPKRPGELKGEADLGRQDFRVLSQAIWVSASVVAKGSSVKEVALDLRVKVRVKVITSTHHPVFRVICRLGRVRCLIDVVAVVASQLKLFAKAVTSHCKPGPPILHKWNRRRLNRQGCIDRYPVIFSRQVDLSPAKLGVK